MASAFKILNGPGKFALMESIFVKDSQKRFEFTLVPESQQPHAAFGPIKVRRVFKIESVGAEDGSGENFRVTLLTEDGQTFKGWYSIAHRGEREHGRLELVEPKAATWTAYRLDTMARFKLTPLGKAQYSRDGVPSFVADSAGWSVTPLHTLAYLKSAFLPESFVDGKVNFLV